MKFYTEVITICGLWIDIRKFIINSINTIDIYGHSPSTDEVISNTLLYLCLSSSYHLIPRVLLISSTHFPRGLLLFQSSHLHYYTNFTVHTYSFMFFNHVSNPAISIQRSILISLHCNLCNISHLYNITLILRSRCIFIFKYVLIILQIFCTSCYT